MVRESEGLQVVPVVYLPDDPPMASVAGPIVTMPSDAMQGISAEELLDPNFHTVMRATVRVTRTPRAGGPPQIFTRRMQRTVQHRDPIGDMMQFLGVLYGERSV